MGEMTRMLNQTVEVSDEMLATIRTVANDSYDDATNEMKNAEEKQYHIRHWQGAHVRREKAKAVLAWAGTIVKERHKAQMREGGK